MNVIAKRDAASHKNLTQLTVGDVIVDSQGARHKVTKIGAAETFDDIWDDQLSDVREGLGQTLWTDTYPNGRGIVTDGEPEKVLFRVFR